MQILQLGRLVMGSTFPQVFLAADNPERAEQSADYYPEVRESRPANKKNLRIPQIARHSGRLTLSIRRQIAPTMTCSGDVAVVSPAFLT